jgi:processing peptidase subunit beta
MTQPLPNHTPQFIEDKAPTYNLTTLPNGVRILTESTIFPHSVNMGILLDCGTRDETADATGYFLALKNTALKTNTRTNEQLNYCMVQMSGGEFEMTYNQEQTFYKGRCLSHDVYDFNQMFADIILDEKTAMDEEAA